MQVSSAVETIQGILQNSSAGHAKAQRVQADPDRSESKEVGGSSRGRDDFDAKHIEKGRLRRARLFRKQEHRALFAAKKQLKHIAHAVRDELKEILRTAEGQGVARANDGADDDLKQALRGLDKTFRQDLKQAFRDARTGGNLDRDQLLADTRAAFERLVNDVKGVLDPGAAEAPDDEDGGQPIGIAPVTIKPHEPAEPTDAPGRVELSASSHPEGGAAVATPDGGPLAELIERIEHLLERLTELLSPSETDDRPTEGSFTVEIAVTIYAHATFSVEGPASGGALDAVS